MSALVSTGEPDRRGPSGLAAAFLVAVVLHLAVLAGMMLFGAPPAAPPGENTISIDLAPQSTEAEAQAPAETAEAVPPPAEEKPTDTPVTEEVTPPETSQVKPLETTEVKPPETAEVKPPETSEVKPPETAEIPPETAQPTPPTEAITEMPPEDQLVASTSEAAEPLAPPPPVVAKVPEPPKPVEPKPVQVVKPKPKLPDPRIEARRQEELEAKREAAIEARQKAAREAKLRAAREASRRAAQEGAAEGRAQRNSASSARQSSTGQASAGNDPNALRAWQSMLSSAINGRMNRNAAAGTAGGTAVVRFTVSRSGQVMSAGLASSSGIGVIDSAALAAVRGSLPAAPAGVSVGSLAVTVPMRFRPGS